MKIMSWFKEVKKNMNSSINESVEFKVKILNQVKRDIGGKDNKRKVCQESTLGKNFMNLTNS